MPSGKLKNIVYQFGLRLAAPSAAGSEYTFKGKQLSTAAKYKKLIRKHHILGSSLYLEYNGQSAVVHSSTADPAHQVKDDSYFRVASITKIAVALLALRLCESGLLSLDEPASNYLPEANCDEINRVTLRQLLSHTTGLSDPARLEKAVEDKRTWDEVLADPSLRFAEPGKGFRYNNFAFGLVGCMIEHVTGLVIEEAFQKYLFSVLDIHATFEPSTLPYDRIVPISRVFPYHKGNDMVVTPARKTPMGTPDPMRHFGLTAGGLYSDLQGILKLLQVAASGGKGYLTTDIGKEIISVQGIYGALDRHLSYGLGMFIINDPSLSSHRILGHQGFAYGCVNGAFVEEDTGKTLVMLNGGCSEARTGRLGRSNYDLLHWAFTEELETWK